MTVATVRLCSPCKASGERVPAGLGKSGRNDRRARVAGKIVNVCDMHGDALTVARSHVSGNGIDARQERETVIFTDDAETLAAELPTLQATRANTLHMLTPHHLDILGRAARRRGWNANHADALFDAMIDVLMDRVGDRLNRGETIDLDAMVYTATLSHENGLDERMRGQERRLDITVTEQGLSLGDVLGNRETEPIVTAWRVGGMTVSVEDLRSLVSGSCPDGVSAEDWVILTANYRD